MSPRELPTRRAPASGEYALDTAIPRAPALPVFATARERAYPMPERVGCAERFDAARETVRPARAA